MCAGPASDHGTHVVQRLEDDAEGLPGLFHQVATSASETVRPTLSMPRADSTTSSRALRASFRARRALAWLRARLICDHAERSWLTALRASRQDHTSNRGQVTNDHVR